MIILATLVGPILAVQAQKFLERSREGRLRRLSIFRTLMATRANVLSASHVEALNAIAIEFYGTKPAFKAVVDAWKDYLDHLNKDTMEIAIWDQKRRDLFVELISHMAPTVGYKFSKLEINNEIYFPKAHGQLEVEQQVIREGMLRIFTGQSSIPVDIRSVSTEAAVDA
jgi:hypothetical protein